MPFFLPRLASMHAVLLGVLGAASAAAIPPGGPAADRMLLACASASSMDAVMDAWTRGFNAQHPAAPARVTLRAQFSADTFAALLRGDVQVAAYPRELFPSETRRYVAAFGRAARLVPVALGSRATKGGTHAIAIFVNERNPVRHLSVPQVADVLAGTITRWGEVGASGAWAQRPIIVHGMMPQRASGDPPGVVNYLEQRVLHGRPWRGDLVTHTDVSGGPQALTLIVRAVAADETALGYSGFGYAEAGVRSVALGATDAGPFLAGTDEEVGRDAYPLTRHLYLCLRGTPTPATVAFLRYVLSEAGQAEIRASPEHFFPLPTAELTAALRALQR